VRNVKPLNASHTSFSGPPQPSAGKAEAREAKKPHKKTNSFSKNKGREWFKENKTFFIKRL